MPSGINGRARRPRSPTKPARQPERLWPGGETFLTLAAIRPFFAGCTQIGAAGTVLRNYDFDPDEVRGVIACSRFLRPVIGMLDGGWGLLDGMNDAGLAVSLTFGGRFAQGPGFDISIVLRYLLETCDTVGEALATLAAVPISIPQNVTLVDAERAVTVYTGPDIAMTTAPDACATNHQHMPIPDEQEQFTRTQERLSAVRGRGRRGGHAEAAHLPGQIRWTRAGNSPSTNSPRERARSRWARMCNARDTATTPASRASVSRPSR